MVNREVVFPFLAALVLGVGLLAVSSAAPEPGMLGKQFLGLGLALPLLGLLTLLGRSRLYALAVPLYLLSLGLLALTLVAGVTVNGSRNWLGSGFFQFQPLEFGKIALILMLARYMKEPIRSWRDYLPIGLISGPMVLLVVAEDFGGTLVLLSIVFGMMLVRGLPWRHILVGAILIGVAAPTVVWSRLEPYQKQRLTIFLNPAADPMKGGYQVIQSMIAVGSGGLTGKGYREGSQSQYGYLPEHHTDFIFAAWAEEQGFVGAVLLLTLYAAMFWRLAALGGECPSEVDRLVVGGVMAQLGFQVLENVGATLGLAPITGLTLPLVSYGVSSLLATALAFGVVYVVHRDRFREL